MAIELTRPDHISDEAWAAIEQHKQRLDIALAMSDLPFAIGSAKEMVESVARVVIEAKSIVVGSNADFDLVLNEAHKALERQPGPNVSMSRDVRDIASSAKKMMLAVRDIRNDFGTGHGRGHVDQIDKEKVWVVIDAVALWTRWALRRLGHLLSREPERLIAELEKPIVRLASLQQHLEAVMLPDQAPDIQRALGAAFARRARRGTFVAREVGVKGAETSEDLKVWPDEYRFGIVEGFVLSGSGFLGLDSEWVPTVVKVLSPVQPRRLAEFLTELVTKVEVAGSSAEPEDLHETAQAIERHVQELPVEVHQIWGRLAELVDPTSPE